MTTTPTLTRPTRCTTVVAMALLMLALVAAPAAAQYPPIPIDTPCATILIEGPNWGPGTTVTIEFRTPPCGQGQQSFTVPVGSDGRFSAQVAVPADAEPDDVLVDVSGTGSNGSQWSTTARPVPVDDAATGSAEQGASVPRQDNGTSGTTSGSAGSAGSGQIVGDPAQEDSVSGSRLVASGPEDSTPASARLTTGAPITPGLLVAAVLLALGLVGLRMARRRSRG